MIAEDASHKFVTLSYMLTDFGVCHCFKAIVLVLMDIFETRDFILCETAYTFRCSSCNASMQPPMPLSFSHGPVILLYISNTFEWINIIPGIVDQSDTVNGLVLFIGHRDLHFMVH